MCQGGTREGDFGGCGRIDFELSINVKQHEKGFKVVTAKPS